MTGGMSVFPIPEAALAQHMAVLGKTGSGKTSTAKLVVEHVVAHGHGARVCILDPIKSDWWGLTSSADGKKPGLPFQILGGPRGHVPLPDTSGKAIGELVASGALPLSIIDMADFEPGGLQRFFTDFAPALLKHMRGVVYLVIEEAHEFAPKERSGIGMENLAIHWAKKLATAGRSKGIRLILATQRTQSLHNALLGSCETLIAHRFSTPADQEPIKAWLKANVDKATLEKVAGSLSSIPTGTAWVCSGEAQLSDLVKFPRISTYDNTATPTSNMGDKQVKTAPVDQDKLRAIIGDAIKDAESNDPRALKAEIARLTRDLALAAKRAQAPAITEADVQKRIKDAIDAYALKHPAQAANNSRNNLSLESALASIAKIAGKALEGIPTGSQGGTAQGPVGVDRMAPVRRTPSTPPAAAVASAAGLSGPEQRILDAIAWLESIGVTEPEQPAVAFLAGYTYGAGAYNNPRGKLNANGMVEYVPGSRIRLTDAGRVLANAPVAPASATELHERVLARLPGPEQRLLRPLLDAYPASMSNSDLAAAANYTPGAGAFNNPRGRLRSLGLIDYPSPGQCAARSLMFPAGLKS